MAGSNMESQNPNDIYGKYIMSRARQCCRPALLLHACFPGGRAARRPGLLPGRFPCGDRGGPERGRETADLPLFQRTKQCGGDGVRRQRLYHPGAAGYFPVNSRNSPQFEGSFELYIFTRGDLVFTKLIPFGNYAAEVNHQEIVTLPLFQRPKQCSGNEVHTWRMC